MNIGSICQRRLVTIESGGSLAETGAAPATPAPPLRVPAVGTAAGWDRS
jgi:hypothetical protein